MTRRDRRNTCATWAGARADTEDNRRGPTTSDDTIGIGPAPPETVALWVKLVATMGPDELAALEERTFPESDRASLTELRGAIRNRWRQLAGD